MNADYRIELTRSAEAMLAAVTDRRERAALLERIARLARDPAVQGKALGGELRAYRSVRAVGQRYRIVYRVLEQRIVVVVVGVGRRREGHRRDAYAAVERMRPPERDE